MRSCNRYTPITAPLNSFVIKVALVGNPNTGKSTIFNSLTGFHQKVGNFPGTTVDKKIGDCNLADSRQAIVIDLPGIYSLYAKSYDEFIVFSTLINQDRTLVPDLIVLVVDASNIKRNLLLYTQVADLKIPIIVALNMLDLVEQSGSIIDIDAFSRKLGVPVVPISAQKSDKTKQLKKILSFSNNIALQRDTIDVYAIAPALIDQIKQKFSIKNPYLALQLAHNYKVLNFLTPVEKKIIEKLQQRFSFHSQKHQVAETIARYDFINSLLSDTVKQGVPIQRPAFSNRMDPILTHKAYGFIIFFFILFLMFQVIFSWSAYPMTLIENLFVYLERVIKHHLPHGPLTNLFADGVLPGLSGIMVFIPQVALLFGCICILEDTGYMARVTFMMDKIMRVFGLNGKSIVALLGGFACAVPSIMGTRTIENWKDRLITILVVPLVTCSARLPVYTLLISLVIPDKRVMGFVNLQGVALMCLYMLGLIAAMTIAYLLKHLIKTKEKSYFFMELPIYRLPKLGNVLHYMYMHVKMFVLQAGKIIVAVSIILWILSAYGPARRIERRDRQYSQYTWTQKLSTAMRHHIISVKKIENSYAGILGHLMEPVISPVGFDWKIGIALITSFAAREIFVGTIATIYSVEESDTDLSKIDSIRDKMRNARNTKTGEPIFTLAVAMSLIIFYAFAMQCVSTLAVAYRETKTWKWPIIQLVYMTVMAYVASFLTYHILK